MKSLLADFNAKVGMEGLFKPIICNESLHEVKNGVKAVAISKNEILKSTTLPHRDIHKHLDFA
jgi:hypothetical protein